jgi:hypothetical protein
MSSCNATHVYYERYCEVKLNYFVNTCPLKYTVCIYCVLLVFSVLCIGLWRAVLVMMMVIMIAQNKNIFIYHNW